MYVMDGHVDICQVDIHSNSLVREINMGHTVLSEWYLLLCGFSGQEIGMALKTLPTPDIFNQMISLVPNVTLSKFRICGGWLAFKEFARVTG